MSSALPAPCQCPFSRSSALLLPHPSISLQTPTQIPLLQDAPHLRILLISIPLTSLSQSPVILSLSPLRSVPGVCTLKEDFGNPKGTPSWRLERGKFKWHLLGRFGRRALEQSAVSLLCLLHLLPIASYTNQKTINFTPAVRRYLLPPPTPSSRFSLILATF